LDNRYFLLSAQLQDLEKVLQDAGLWADVPPSESALESEQPFAMDTLEFWEWLQFVFLPKMHHLLQSKSPLPSNCAISPMAEEYCKVKGVEFGAVIRVLSSIDQLLTEGKP
jgi:uncharacterized protein YqcC (DUF446 family)